MYQSTFETELGRVRVYATERGICKIDLPAAHSESASVLLTDDDPSSPLTEQVAIMINLYFSGRRQPFETVPVDLTGLTLFRTRILTLIREIPYGETRSYGEVSIMAGTPGAARAVGGAMAANPVPVIIPCHRIVAADGRLTGFTAPGGLELKKNLLQAEGIDFKGEHVLQKCQVINMSDMLVKKLDTCFQRGEALTTH